jgi:hypothetical protein
VRLGPGADDVLGPAVVPARRVWCDGSVLRELEGVLGGVWFEMTRQLVVEAVEVLVDLGEELS